MLGPSKSLWKAVGERGGAAKRVVQTPSLPGSSSRVVTKVTKVNPTVVTAGIADCWLRICRERAEHVALEPKMAIRGLVPAENGPETDSPPLRILRPVGAASWDRPQCEG